MWSCFQIIIWRIFFQPWFVVMTLDTWLGHKKITPCLRHLCPNHIFTTFGQLCNMSKNFPTKPPGPWQFLFLTCLNEIRTYLLPSCGHCLLLCLTRDQGLGCLFLMQDLLQLSLGSEQGSCQSGCHGIPLQAQDIVPACGGGFCSCLPFAARMSFPSAWLSCSLARAIASVLWQASCRHSLSGWKVLVGAILVLKFYAINFGGFCSDVHSFTAGVFCTMEVRLEVHARKLVLYENWGSQSGQQSEGELMIQERKYSTQVSISMPM